jgi:hypothetical protein
MIGTERVFSVECRARSGETGGEIILTRAHSTEDVCDDTEKRQETRALVKRSGA